jgi:uncharacterized protein
MAPLDVIWRNLDPADPSLEHGQVTPWTALSGTVVALSAGCPLTLQYRVEIAPDGHPRSADLSLSSGASLTLARSTIGGWTINGAPAAQMAGCTDLDIRLTPSTNTLPIRRLALEVGAAAEIQVVWVDVPSFDLRVVRQRYTRLRAHCYQYDNLLSGYQADITVDDLGLVTGYPGAFERLNGRQESETS